LLDVEAMTDEIYCIVNTNYTKKIVEIQNTLYILKVSKMPTTNYTQSVINAYFNYFYFK